MGKVRETKGRAVDYISSIGEFYELSFLKVFIYFYILISVYNDIYGSNWLHL